MRKQVKIIGIGHKSGTNSKTNKSYDFYILNGTFVDPDTEGLAVISCSVPDSMLPEIEVGADRIIFTHYHNGREVIDGIFPV